MCSFDVVGMVVGYLSLVLFSAKKPAASFVCGSIFAACLFSLYLVISVAPTQLRG